jgi:hypothetical protein
VPESGDARTLLALEPQELLLAGFLENRGMVLIFGALALLDQTGASTRFIERMFETPDTVLGDLAARFPGFSGLPVMRGAIYFTIALLVILLFIRVISTLWAVIRLYGFRLERRGDDLHTEYGLFTRVTATTWRGSPTDCRLHQAVGRSSPCGEAGKPPPSVPQGPPLNATYRQPKYPVRRYK